MIELLLRLVASLAVVVGLLLVLARLGSRRFSGGPDGIVRVLHRQPLSRTSSLAVVDIAGRVLVLGATENQISLVTELDAADVEDAVARGALPAQRRAESTASDASDVSDVDRDEVAAVAALTSRRADRSHRAGAPRPLAGAGGLAPLNGSVLSPATWQAARAAVTGRNPAGRRRAGGSRRAS